MTSSITLEPSDIRQCWDEVRPGLEEIKARWPEANTWRPEDVYAAVVNGDAVLYRTEDGFAVCTIEVDQYTGTKDLFIWIAHAPEEKRGGMLQKQWPSFIEVAERLGCKGIQTGSLHPALESWGVMTKMHIIYRYEL
jgi:hypothetical protein